MLSETKEKGISSKKDTHNIKHRYESIVKPLNRFIFLKEQCKIIFKKFKNF